MFRIVTENRNLTQIKEALARFGLDYTMYRAEGCWQGHSERSVAIELDNTNRSSAEIIALAIKYMNQQEAVLLQEIPVTSTLL